MAIINLDLSKITSISNELSALDTTLLNSYVPELKGIINEIKNNVRNTEVNSILGTISSQVDTISGELAVDLPKLEAFLENQMKSYQVSETEAAERVDSVVQKMASFAGMGKSQTNKGKTGSDENASDSKNEELERRIVALEKENKELSKSTWEKAGDEFKSDMSSNWETYKSNLSNLYSDTRTQWAQGDYGSAVVNAFWETPQALFNVGRDTLNLGGSSILDGAGFVIDSIIPGLDFLA